MQVCLDSPLPTLDGILNSFKPLMTFPPKFPALPKIPLLNLPHPLFPSMHVPNFELMLTALELQAFQLQTTIMGMIKPILDKLGIALSVFLPKIPGLPNLNLIDLLAGKVDKIIAAVKAAILNGFRLPMLPFPLYGTLKIPDFEIIQTMQIIIANYMQMVAKLIPDLIKKVTDKFKWPGLPKIPSLPDMDMILAMIMSKLPALPKIPNLDELKAKLTSLQAQAETAVGDAKKAIEKQISELNTKINDLLSKIPKMPAVPSLNDIVERLKLTIMDKFGNFDIMGFFSKLVFPGLPALPAIPLPLVFSFKMPNVDFVAALNALYTHLTTGFLKPIMDFILKTLSKFLSFTFPKLCINIPVPSMPVIPSPTIPKLR